MSELRVALEYLLSLVGWVFYYITAGIGEKQILRGELIRDGTDYTWISFILLSVIKTILPNKE